SALAYHSTKSRKRAHLATVSGDLLDATNVAADDPGQLGRPDPVVSVAIFSSTRLGGRTRARTWDPLIKSPENQRLYQWDTRKPVIFRAFDFALELAFWQTTVFVPRGGRGRTRGTIRRRSYNFQTPRWRLHPLLSTQALRMQSPACRTKSLLSQP